VQTCGPAYMTGEASTCSAAHLQRSDSIPQGVWRLLAEGSDSDVAQRLAAVGSAAAAAAAEF
jgi:hypothetical protein